MWFLMGKFCQFLTVIRPPHGSDVVLFSFCIFIKIYIHQGLHYILCLLFTLLFYISLFCLLFSMEMYIKQGHVLCLINRMYYFIASSEFTVNPK